MGLVEGQGVAGLLTLRNVTKDKVFQGAKFATFLTVTTSSPTPLFLTDRAYLQAPYFLDGNSR